MQNEISFVFTESAQAVLNSEGIKTHRFETTPFPAIPIEGDLLSWDWIADGKLFRVESRLFIWNDPQNVVVQLLLDAVPR